jgi:hypothetical protein
MATPMSICPGVPEPLSNLVMECVKTNPAKRPPDLKDVARRLGVVKYAMDKQAAAKAGRDQHVA